MVSIKSIENIITKIINKKITRKHAPHISVDDIREK